MAPPKKKTRQGTNTNTDSSNNNKRSKSSELQSISSVLRRITAAATDSNSSDTILAELEDTAYLHRTIWPTILRHPEEEQLNDAALLFAILVNYSRTNHSKLDFIVNTCNNSVDNDNNSMHRAKEAWIVTLRVLLTRSDLGVPVPCTKSQHLTYNYKLECQRIQFLNTAFQNLELGYSTHNVNVVSDGVLPIVGVQLYEHMSARRRALEFAWNPSNKKIWDLHMEAAEKHKSKKARLLHNAKIKITYVADVVVRALDLLDVMEEEDDEDEEGETFSGDQLNFLYRALELFADLLSSRQTGRWLRGLPLDYGFTVRASFSGLMERNKLFRQLLEVCLYFYEYMDVWINAYFITLAYETYVSYDMNFCRFNFFYFARW